MSPTASRRDAQTWVTVAVAWAFYFVLVVVFRERYVDVLAPLGVLPIVATGLLLGPWLGLGGGALAIAIAVAVRAQQADVTLAADLQQNWFRWVVGLSLGYGSGALADGLRAQRRLATTLAGKQRSWDTLLANAPDFVLVIDQAERIVYANRTPKGLTVDAVRGQPIAAFVDNPAQRLALLEAIRQALSGGPATILELQGPGPDGRVSTYRCRILPTTESDGSRAALMLNVDITGDLEAERVLAERNAELERAQERLNEAQALAHLGSWEVDIPAGMLGLSPEAWRIWGFQGKPRPVPVAEFYSRMHPEDVASMAQDVRQAVEHGHDYQRIVRIKGGAPGAWRWARSRGRVTERGPGGEPVRMAGTVEDITEEHDAEQRLVASEARWRSLAENAPAFILTCDTEGRITYVNRSVPGLPVEAVVGRLAWELAPPGVDQGPLREAIVGVVRTGVPRTMESQGPGPGGRLNWYATSWAAVHEAGRVTGLIAMATDITPLKEAERQREEARAAAAAQAAERRRMQEMAEFKTQFLNNAAHELATPLTPIKLQLATLKGTALAKRDPAAFDLLDRNLSRLVSLVNDLLDTARLQSGHFKMRPAPVVVPDLLARVAASFKELAKESGVTLGVQPSVGRLVLTCDEMRVEQVLFNLVHNSLKFTPRGGQVWLSDAVDGQHALIEVRDTGVGLTPAQAAMLFQPFTQVHEAANGRAGGTGLGLHIARGIAEQHGGTLTATSPGPAQGSTFTLRLPLSPAGPAAASASAQGSAAAPPRASGAPGAPPAGP